MNADDNNAIDALIRSGDLAGALEECRGACARHPGLAAGWLALADVLMRVNDATGAHQAAVRAARCGAAETDLLRVLAPAAIAVGDRNAAGQCMAKFEQLPEEQRPALLWYWAERLEDLYRYEQAATMLQPLTARPAADYRTLVYCAQLLLKAHRAEAARELIQRARSLEPERAGARLAAMRLAIQQGDRDCARREALAVLAVEPESLPALTMLAEIAPGDVTGDGIAALKRSLAADDQPADARGSAGLALGRVHEHAGCYSEAFAAYVAGNRALKQLAAQRGLDYDRQLVDDDVARLRSVFDQTSAPAIGSNHGARLIFIVGMPRSGTTLIDRVLAAHPQVTSVGESPSMPAVAERIGMYSADAENVRARLANEPDRFRQSYLDALPEQPAHDHWIVDKLPLNFWNVGLIRALFPAAVIIHARRNPLDIALSSFRLRFPETFRYVNDLADFAHYYAAYLRLMQTWRVRFGDGLHQFDYDDAVADFEPAVRRLLAACGLAWNDACLEFHRHAGAVYTLSQGQVHQPLYKTASGRWHCYARELEPLRAELRRTGQS